MSVPSWWESLVMGLAVVYGFYLVSEAVILERPRDWILLRVDEKWEAFVECPWCVGFWLSLIVWLCWLATPTWTVGLCVPFALAAVNGLVHRTTDST